MTTQNHHRLLSICVPTHDGRREELRHLLRATLAQLSGELGDRVQICVSDNASEDGTETLLRELAAERPGVLVHHRQATDVGAERNIFSAVELADGEYCWMMSSDDAPAPGAVARVVSLLDRERPAGGVTLDWTTWDRDMRAIAVHHPDEIKPTEPISAARYRTYSDVLANLGLLFGYMSIHVFRAAAWRAAIDRRSEVWLRSSPMFAHVYVLGAIASITEDWLWVPIEAVNARVNKNEWGATRPASSYHARSTCDIARVWRQLVGARSDVYKTLLRRWYHHCATPQHVMYYKQDPLHTIKWDLCLLGAMVRTLMPDSEFRRHTFPLLLLPAPLIRRSPSLRARLGAWPDMWSGG